jgi:hypothetical protein
VHGTVLITALFAVVGAIVGTSATGVVKSGADNLDDPAEGASPDPDLIALVRLGASVRSGIGAAAVDRAARLARWNWWAPDRWPSAPTIWRGRGFGLVSWRSRLTLGAGR